MATLASHGPAFPILHPHTYSLEDKAHIQGWNFHRNRHMSKQLVLVRDSVLHTDIASHILRIAQIPCIDPRLGMDHLHLDYIAAAFII